MALVRTVRVAVLASVISITAACSGTAVAPADRAAMMSASPTGEYLIGPGDVLQVFVWREDDLSVEVPVRPDGRISTPLVEDMVAVGKTPTQLANDIEQVLSEVIRNPEVNIIVTDFVGTAGDQVRVLGQVTNPSSIPFRERMTPHGRDDRGRWG